MNPIKNRLFLIGVNHDTAPLEVRERVAFDIDKLADSYYELKNKVEVEESLILSTCNRTEIYVVCDDYTVVSKWLAQTKDISPDILSCHFYVRSAGDVLVHAASVASGLNSMVVGETQILGQMKLAYQHADTSDCLGRTLRKTFDMAFSAAKEVRSNTDIGKHSVSMASSSIRAIERIFPDLHEQSVLFIGAGEMIGLFSQHFATKSFKSLTFCNRTTARSEILAERYSGKLLELSDVGRSLAHYDIVVSCTASPIPILGKGVFEESLRLRRHKPIVVFDLAVPRDVEAPVNALDDVFLFTVDDLGEMVKKGVSVRESALDDAKKIISRRIADFESSEESDESVRTVKAFRNLGTSIVKTESERAIAALGRGDDPTEVVRRLSNSLLQKFLDRPSRALRGARGEKKKKLREALIKLFELGDSA